MSAEKRQGCGLRGYLSVKFRGEKFWTVFLQGSDRTRATVKISFYSLLRAAIRPRLLCDFDTCQACSGSCVRLRSGELGNIFVVFCCISSLSLNVFFFFPKSSSGFFFLWNLRLIGIYAEFL